MQRSSRYLGRIKNTHIDHIAVFARACIVAKASFALFYLINYHRAFLTSVFYDLTQRRFHGAQGNAYTHSLVVIITLEISNFLKHSDQCNTTTSNNAFFNRRASCVQSIFNTSFLLFHFDLSGCTDLNHSNTAG